MKMIILLEIIMYSTDLEETQKQVIKKILNIQVRKQKYDMICMKYLMKTGCKWRIFLLILFIMYLFITIITNVHPYVNMTIFEQLT